MNPGSVNNEAVVNFEENALDIKSGIEFLRKQPGITKVLLFGHSGGGPATSFYQVASLALRSPSHSSLGSGERAGNLERLCPGRRTPSWRLGQLARMVPF
jgi:hypothetical protein